MTTTQTSTSQTTATPFNTNSTFSAATASIKFGTVEIGYLQDFNIDENNSVQRVKAIGRGTDQAHIPGFQELTLTARRSMIDASLFMSLLSNVSIDALKNATGTTGTANITGVTYDQLLKALTDSSNPLSKSKRAVSVTFDIEINSVDAAGNPTTLMTLNKCTMTTKRFTMSTGNIVIGEDCTFFPQYRTNYNNAEFSSTIVTA